jgi:hypothetical protein
MRTARNIAIVALLAVPVAFVPGGGNAARAILAALTLAFLATIALAVRQLYAENRLTVDTLPEGERVLLFGSVGLLMLMAVGADEMLGGGGGLAVLWVTLVAVAVIAIAGVWTRSRA